MADGGRRRTPPARWSACGNVLRWRRLCGVRGHGVTRVRGEIVGRRARRWGANRADFSLGPLLGAIVTVDQASQLQITIERVPIHTDADGVVRVAGTRVTLDTIVAAFDAGATAERFRSSTPLYPCRTSTP